MPMTRWIIVLLTVALLATREGSLALDLNNLRPAQDTYVLENAEQSSFGANTTVLLGNVGVGCGTCAAVILLQYDLSAIPRNAVVNSATLSFERHPATQAGNLTVALQRRPGSWNEINATWGSTNPRSDPFVGTVIVNTSLNFPLITDGALKTLVAGWIADPTSNKGLSIQPESGSGAVSFYSKESGTGNPIRLSVNYSLPPQTLTIVKSGNGSGNVTSNPSGINCGSDCSESYALGTLVTLTPTPSSNSNFAGWSGACSGLGSCLLTMNSTQSATAAFSTTIGIPTPDPSWLRVSTVSKTQLDLLWDEISTNEAGFKVERKDGCCGPWTEVASLPANATTYQSTGLTCGTSYAYRVWAFNATGSSGKTNEASSTTSACSPGSVPAPDPSWLRVSAISSTRIDLQWDESSANEAGFKVERKQGCCGPWEEIATLPANTTTYQSTGLTCGATYAYRVWAFNSAGNSNRTNEAAATTPGC